MTECVAPRLYFPTGKKIHNEYSTYNSILNASPLLCFTFKTKIEKVALKEI